jgi:hypothetical protein
MVFIGNCITFVVMNNRTQPKHKLIAWVLVSTYVVFWLSWSLHHFFAPEHQHETKVCRHAPNEKHFHGEEYAGVDCSICQIAPTLAELPFFRFPDFLCPELIPSRVNFGETTGSSVSPLTLFQPRAPPARMY